MSGDTPVDIPTTTVEPGRIRQFAQFLDDLATWWKPTVDRLHTAAEPGSTSWGTLQTSDGTETITAAEQFEQQYKEGTVKPTAQTAEALYNQLIRVREAANDIADQYTSLEALNQATAEQIKTALDAVPPPPGSAGATSPGGTTYPSQPGGESGYPTQPG